MSTVQYRMIMMVLLMIAAKLSMINEDPWAVIGLTMWSIGYFVAAVIQSYKDEKK